jgi:hypothetical protein
MPIYNKLICNGLHKIFMQRTVYYKICLLLLRSLLLHFYENEYKSLQHLINRSGLIDPPNLDHSLIQDGPEFAIKRDKLISKEISIKNSPIPNFIQSMSRLLKQLFSN